MRKAIIAAIAALSACALTLPVYAVTGHIIQVHHGADCVEFVLLEDANPASCVQETGALDDACLARPGVLWYGVPTGPASSGQPQLTVGQIIAETSAIDTAYKAYSNLFQLELVQNALLISFGFTNSVVDPRQQALHDQTSLVGFTVNNTTLNCKNLGDANGMSHPVGMVGNINIPPSINQFNQ
jgi:hypothetical protein